MGLRRPLREPLACASGSIGEPPIGYARSAGCFHNPQFAIRHSYVRLSSSHEESWAASTPTPMMSRAAIMTVSSRP